MSCAAAPRALRAPPVASQQRPPPARVAAHTLAVGTGWIVLKLYTGICGGFHVHRERRVLLELTLSADRRRPRIACCGLREHITQLLGRRLCRCTHSLTTMNRSISIDLLRLLYRLSTVPSPTWHMLPHAAVGAAGSQLLRAC